MAERNCDKCVHHIGGACSKWKCEFQTLADHDKQIRDEAIDEIVDSLTCQACFTNMQKDAIRIYAQQMKGEQNGN